MGFWGGGGGGGGERILAPLTKSLGHMKDQGQRHWGNEALGT